MSSHELSKIESPYIQHMISIADGKIPEYNQREISAELNAFLLAQARNELIRAVRYTELLDKVDRIFLSRVDENANDYSLKQLTQIIDTMTLCLDRSTSIISKLLSNDNISILIDASQKIIAVNSEIHADNSNVLKDAASRERVRSVIQTIINDINNVNYNEVVNNTDDYVDVSDDQITQDIISEERVSISDEQSKSISGSESEENTRVTESRGEESDLSDTESDFDDWIL